MEQRSGHHEAGSWNEAAAGGADKMGGVVGADRCRPDALVPVVGLSSHSRCSGVVSIPSPVVRCVCLAALFD